MVCGHIHKAEHAVLNGIEYWNDGDWVESCSVIAETMDGTMSISQYLPDAPTVARLRARAMQRWPPSTAPLNAGEQLRSSSTVSTALEAFQ